MNFNEITKQDDVSENFKRWFGNSKTVDSSGKPMVFYHGTGAKFSAFSKAKPPFFTQDKTYATGYGKGGGKQRILKVYLKMEKPFDTATDPKAVEVYNEMFVPWARGRFARRAELENKDINEWFHEIKPGERVHFFTADELFTFLRIMDREGKLNYDGMIVDEGDFSEYPSYIPLFVNHIKSVRNKSFTDSDDIMETNVTKNIRKFAKDYSKDSINTDIYKHAARDNPAWVKFLIKKMKEHGFEFAGAGMNGAVFKNPSYPWVLKVYRTDHAYEEWVDFMHSNQSNKYVPKIKRMPKRINKIFSMIQLEPLMPANVNRANKLADKIEHLGYDYWRNKEKHDQETDPDLIEIAKHVRDNESMFDLTVHNIMQRPTGDLVIIDPYYDDGEGSESW